MSPLPVVQITFLPEGRSVSVPRGSSILKVSQAHGFNIHFECDGNCTCGTCWVVVQSGENQLTPINTAEQNHLLRQNLPKNARLSCQARVLGDVVVHVPPLK